VDGRRFRCARAGGKWTIRAEESLMRKWLVLLAAVGVVGAIWYVARQYSVTPLSMQPKFGKVTRGDVRVPVIAAGLIRPSQEIEVKSMASGRILEVPVVEGNYVRSKMPLVTLDPIDEQRSLDRAQADLDRSEAMLTQSRVAVDRAQVNIESSKARLEEIEAQGAMAAFERKKMEDSLKPDGTSQSYSAQEINDIRARDRMSRAQADEARIAITAAELAKQDAEAAVKSQEAIVESARKNKEDGEKRLSETTVLAPQEAIVTSVYVRPGMLVQSATQGFTGGTPLMTLADVLKKKVIARLDEADYGRVLSISPIDALPDMPELRETAKEDAEQIQNRSGKVSITVDAFPDHVFEGVIERVEPQGKLNAGSSIIQFDVHVLITDPEGHMLPLGAQAQVEFTVQSAVAALLVPAEAVKTYEEQRGVWIKKNPEAGSSEKYGKQFVSCQFGISDGEHTQVIKVLGGKELKEDTEVYTKLPQDGSEGGH
jgi:multidrug efflux pump subunit AcrA (membrane-fusion protein)